MKKLITIVSFPLVFVSLVFLFSSSVQAAPYIFPVVGSASFSNDYSQIHNGVRHHAIDIIAGKHQQVVSAADGTVEYVTYPQPSWGNAVIIKSTGGYCYWYLHLNNDNRGTDDGKGGAMKAFAADMNRGNPVKKGQLIGWVGDSGNAENTVSHLHFGVHKLPNSSARCFTSHEDDNPPINPYNNLRSATHIGGPKSYPALPGEILPFGAAYTGKINVTRGDVNGDGTEELIAAAGHGGSPRINVYNNAGSRLASFYAFSKSLPYGTDVAVGDVDGDGKNEIVATARTDSTPMIAIFKLTTSPTTTLQKVGEFPAFPNIAKTNNSPRIAVGNIDGVGPEEIIVGAGNNQPPRVNIFNNAGTLLKSFLPYATDFTGGVDVTAGDVANTSADEIITSPLTTGSSRVQVFNGSTLAKLSEFYAYGSSYRGGAWISAGNINTGTPKLEIATMPNGASPRISYFNNQGTSLGSSYYMEEWWRHGYYDIGAGQGKYSIATGYNRRGSVR